MRTSLIALGLPALLVFGTAAAGWWNVAQAPLRPPVKPLGDPRPVVGESTIVHENGTPRELIQGVLAARKRGDLSWLARALRSCIEAPQLTESETSIAWLRFEWGEAQKVWDRIAAAEAQRPAEIRIEGNRATATWEVGGALGTLTVPFVSVGGQWCIADL